MSVLFKLQTSSVCHNVCLVGDEARKVLPRHLTHTYTDLSALFIYNVTFRFFFFYLFACHGKTDNIDRIFRVHLMTHCQKVLKFFQLYPYNARNAPLQLPRNTSACLVTDTFQPVAWTQTRSGSLLWLGYLASWLREWWQGTPYCSLWRTGWLLWIPK